MSLPDELEARAERLRGYGYYEGTDECCLCGKRVPVSELNMTNPISYSPGCCDACCEAESEQ